MNNPTDKKVIITGGTGYIGSHTAVCLLEKGMDVVLIDNLANSKADVVEQIEKITGKTPDFYELDICDYAALNSCLKEHSDSVAVIHFAGLKAVGESVEKPLDYYQNNVGGTLTLLKAMLQNNITNIIFSSSSTVYGKPQFFPMTEDHPIGIPMSPYGNTKRQCEEILEAVANSNAEFCAISLRYFNPIGAHESRRIGENPSGIPNNLLPYITQTVKGIRSQLTIFGNDYNTTDGTPIRDYIHVVDLAEAHTKALNYMIEKQPKTGYEVFNLGTGKCYTVLQIVQAFEKTTGKKVNYHIGPRRDGDVEKLCASHQKAKEKLHWEANYTLEEMLLSAWEWELNKAK